MQSSHDVASEPPAKRAGCRRFAAVPIQERRSRNWDGRLRRCRFGAQISAPIIHWRKVSVKRVKPRVDACKASRGRLRIQGGHLVILPRIPRADVENLCTTLTQLCGDTLATIANPPGRIYEKHALTVTPSDGLKDTVKTIIP